MKVPVTLTSDFICPWCYLGQARFFKAVANLPAGITVSLGWQAYELNPDLPPEGMDRKSYRSRKFGWQRSLLLDAQLTALGQEEGLDFRFGKIARTPNTRLAHRLSLFAARHGRQTEFAGRVLRAYFSEGQDIGSLRVLLELAGASSLAPAEALRFLNEGQGEAEISAAASGARRAGIDAVPYFRIGNVEVAGAQDWRVLHQALLAAAG